VAVGSVMGVGVVNAAGLGAGVEAGTVLRQAHNTSGPRSIKMQILRIVVCSFFGYELVQ
jgi:hypothetical protein